MARRKRYDAFVSYSHKDAAIVKPLVQVLSVAKRRVFWDEIIQPGQEWNAEIEKALAASDAIVVMWCCDSAASDWVAREIAAARTLLKPLTPIRLCAYPLRGEVAYFQAIDFSKDLHHVCDCARKKEAGRRPREEQERSLNLWHVTDYDFRQPAPPGSKRTAWHVLFQRVELLLIVFGLVGVGFIGMAALDIFGYRPTALTVLLVLLLVAVLCLEGIRAFGHFRKARELKILERRTETIRLIRDALLSERRTE
jgi:TIR domain